MAYGKIIYTPIPTKALQFDGSHYATMDSAAFNCNTQDFAIDALLYVDPAVADAECWIAAKGALDLANAAGWHWYYRPGARRLGLRINAGGASPVVVETADNALPALGSWFWARLQADRDGQARFLVNAADVGGGSIAAAAGSLNNTQLLRIGAYDAANHRHQGAMDFIRFDLGRLLSSAWHVKEWDKIRYGMPREVADFLARWNFEESLVDDSESLFTLTWQGGGSPAYVTGWPSAAAPLTYSFRRHFSRLSEGPQPSWLDTDDNQRAINGAAFSYSGALKQRWSINFPLIDEEQYTAFRAAEAGRGQFAFFADAEEPRSFWAKFGERLQPQTLMDGWYSLKTVLEET